MSNFNKVILLGRLTRDPEHRVTPSGLSITKLGLAVSRKYKAQDGSMKEETTFLDIDSFGKQAEVISKYSFKGDLLFIEGRLKLDQWESQTGEKRSKVSVVLENFQFVGSGKKGSSDGISPHSSSSDFSQNAPAPAYASASNDNFDDDVPF